MVKVTANDVADYMAKALPKTVGRWPRTRLVEWLTFQANQGAMIAVTNEDQIHGVAIGVRCEGPDMDDQWTRWNDHGPFLYVHQIAADNAQALTGLLILMKMRIPDWETVRIVGQRHGRRHRVSTERLARLWTRAFKAAQAGV